MFEPPGSATLMKRFEVEAAMELLTARCCEYLVGPQSCDGRIVIMGKLPGACFAAGLTSLLYSRGIRILDYPQFAMPLRDRIRENAQELAAKHGATIKHIAKAHVRKEGVVAKVLAARGDAPRLVHVVSVMETCARPTSPGTTRSAGAHSCGPTPPSACTASTGTTSTGWTANWA